MVYRLLVEHANQEQVDEIDRTLDMPFGGEDGYDAAAEQRLVNNLNLMFSGGPVPDDE